MKKIMMFFVMSYSLYASAGVELGVGNTTATGGRIHLSTHLGYVGNEYIMTGFSSGVSSKLYYQSVYGLSIYKRWLNGEFLYGKLFGAIGLGATYSDYAFQDLNSTTEEKATDFTFGPAFRLNWVMATNFYIGLEAIFGIRSFDRHVLLHFQDTVMLSMGFKIF